MEKPKLIENNLYNVMKEKGITKYKMAKELGKHWNTVNDWTNATNMNSSDMRVCANFLKVDVTKLFKI